MEPTMWHDSDDHLMQELKEAISGPGYLPDHMLETAKAAYAWRGVDEELELLNVSYDSSLGDLALVRGPALDCPRMLVFESEGLTVELEVSGGVLMGQTVPARRDRIILESAHGQIDETEADDAGFFLFRRPAAGPMRVRSQTQPCFVTDWIPV